MVSLLSQKPGVHVGFNIDALLGSQTKMSTIGNEFLHNTESAFTNLKAPLKDANIRMDATTAITNRGGLNGNTVNVATSATAPTQTHSHRDNGEFCAQCFDSSTTNIQDNLLNSVRSYEMSTQSLTNLNSMNTRNLIRSAGLSSHPWSLIDPNHQHVPSVQSRDFRSHSNLGNFGLKFHNSLVQLDNISNIQSMQNIPSIANTYSPFSSLYSPVGQGQFGSQVVPSRVEHGVSGSAFTWSSNRGAGFLTSRCPDTGLFMQSYRKPKRVRTAFSPTQLLRLEHAFEKNHYVVGQERKDLSASLNLSETQVKVWFQNRRTKHKRMQAEDDMTSSMSMRMHESRDCKTPSLEDVVIDA